MALSDHIKLRPDLPLHGLGPDQVKRQLDAAKSLKSGSYRRLAQTCARFAIGEL